MFENKNVLITGGSGMIGRQLIDILLSKRANITVADLKQPKDLLSKVNFVNADLREFSQCREICKNKDFIFNLVGIKASPKACLEQPANIMGPMMQFNTNMLEAAMLNDIEWYLYTSTIGVYQPAPILFEDDVWTTVPSKNDWYGGWAKRMGELQIKAYEVQNKISKCSIVRPANVYGPFDNFDLNSAMVIPSLILKADENDKLYVWGDGNQVRDFIHAYDVARAMVFVVENKITEPLNVGSGNGVLIKDVAEIIALYFDKTIEWDITKPTGDEKRIFDTTKINAYGFYPSMTLKDGILNTIEWYLSNKDNLRRQYTILQ
jgi:GDP-L-fucose synthase